MQKIVIIDYNMGNLFSVSKKLQKIGVDSIVTSSQSEIETADKIILPGVGHFGRAIQHINNLGIKDILDYKVLENKTPVLGICLGMQLMCQSSEEGNCGGLAWIDATVNKFSVNDSLHYKIPHTGWNRIKIKKESPLMKEISQNEEFYFVHSYYVKCNNQSDIMNSTNHESEFTSAFQKENIFGVQYHPEKSFDQGEVLFQNFIDL